jgi:general secretion pathway protein N
MKVRASLLLALAGVALLAGARLLLEPETAAAPEIAPVPPPSHASAAPEQHEPDVQGWKASNLARPLFSRSRRPPPPLAPAFAAAAPPPLPPRLTAVLVGPSGSSAMFVASGSAKPITVHEGGQVGPYRIRRISPGEVLVEAPDGEHLLHPAFAGPADRQPAPPQRAMAPPRQQLASRLEPGR